MASHSPGGVGSYRLALFALFVVSAFNYVDRTILSILQIPIKQELGLSDGQLGALTGFAFALFYATLSLPIARMADRFSRRWIIVASLVVWSAMTATCGLAWGFASLAFFRIGVAIGEAGSVPASVSLIADYYPAERRASALAMWGLALPVGLLVGYASTGWLASAVGWREAFFIVGGIGVVLAPVLFAMIKEPPRGQSEAVDVTLAPPPRLGKALQLFWGNKAYRYIVMAGMLHGFSQYAMMTWNAPFFSRAHGLSLTQVSGLMAMLGGVAGGLGMYLSGVLADRLGRRDSRWRVWIISASVAAMLPFTLVQYLVASTSLSIASALAAAVMMTAYYGPLVAATQSVTPPNMRALGQAMLLLAFNLFGLGLGPWLTGLLSDRIASLIGADGLHYALVLALLPSLVSVWLFFHAARFYAETVESGAVANAEA
ncbi:MAG: MFS transporter [Blastomonas sp. CACIA14H2]|uniref:spinster family MFS transporter n=1 Tax=Blastomonas sp. CACIA14H2 TaxID=1419876 RepID=UPI0003D0116E|nr:MAG: MFS transporter [Blastomonas sp. CACIA14H2]